MKKVMAEMYQALDGELFVSPNEARQYEFAASPAFQALSGARASARTIGLPACGAKSTLTAYEGDSDASMDLQARRRALAQTHG